MRAAGRIAYRSPDGAEVGGERFELLSHAGGHILRALCSIDESALLRDVTLAMDRDWHPLDAFLRLTRDGRPLASMFFHVDDGQVSVQGSAHGQAIDGSTLTTAGRIPYLGLHPLQGDALIAKCRGTDRPGMFVSIDAVTNSVSPDGDERPGLFPVTIDVAYLGEEAIEVTAGRFDARRYALRWRPDWPAADMWVRATDAIFLKMTWAHVPTWYELAELDD